MAAKGFDPVLKHSRWCFLNSRWRSRYHEEDPYEAQPCVQSEGRVGGAARPGVGVSAEIARRYKVHANVVYKWKRQLLDNAAQSFETDHSDGGASDREDVLLKKIGELTVERDFLSNGLGRSR